MPINLTCSICEKPMIGNQMVYFKHNQTSHAVHEHCMERFKIGDQCPVKDCDILVESPVKFSCFAFRNEHQISGDMFNSDAYKAIVRQATCLIL